MVDIFGIFGNSPAHVVGTKNAACARDVAEGYGQINRIRTVCVTYCVQRLSLCNSIAGVSAEKSPVIISAVHLG
ncbi:MAG: hypothetical protein DWI22_07640 [Planctomycetota bacterium]|nr:MAG: hypothetical protein DWI22_07640 [Planctomycetota bacterium]